MGYNLTLFYSRKTRAMKKLIPSKDLLIILLLFGVMMGWGPFYQKFIAEPVPAAKPSAMATNEVVATAFPAHTSQVELVAARMPSVPPAVTAAAPVAVLAHTRPEQTAVLSNGVVRLTLSSWGGGVKAVEMPGYRMALARTSGAVRLEFAEHPALAYEQLPGLDAQGDFAITVLQNGLAARLEAQAPDGLKLVRQVTLGDRYQVRVEDTFVNGGAATTLPPHAMQVGDMAGLPGESAISGVDFLGVDSLPSVGGERVRHWGYKRFFSDDITLAMQFDEAPRRGHGCVGRPAMTRPLPASIRQPVNAEMDWVAVKNKFFVQILSPKDPMAGIDLMADRKVSPFERNDDPRTWDQVAVLKRTAAAARFNARPLAAGEAYTRSFSYYAGPKELAAIRSLGNHQKDVMEFGSLKWLCEGLVWALGALYRIIPNYGVAIILLTLIVRVIFWPLTHKGTESMKRMQEIQPKLNELKAKYKDKPQKLQQETMALYREHKINPLGGCLPMLIQIPVFFALFSVLRSAIELRFAPFLWVRDLSAPEGLLAGVLPGGWTLNILPLLMAGTQAWQQHLTPSGGDPAQQKMMMMMPIVMLLFLYSMPSALVLYWTANQVLMIIQLLWQRRNAKPA